MWQVDCRPHPAPVDPVSFGKSPIKSSRNTLENENHWLSTFILEVSDPVVDQTCLPLQRLHHMLGEAEFTALVRFPNISKTAIARVEQPVDEVSSYALVAVRHPILG